MAHCGCEFDITSDSNPTEECLFHRQQRIQARQWRKSLSYALNYLWWLRSQWADRHPRSEHRQEDYNDLCELIRDIESTIVENR